MSPDELLEVFHRRIRMPGADAIPGWKQERDGLVDRSYHEGGVGFVESPAGLGDDPDAVIARQVAFFAGRGMTFEWKTYDYDEPADLGQRLVRAGFSAEEPEALVLGETGEILRRQPVLPSGLRLRDVTDPVDFHRIALLTDTLWSHGLASVEERLAGEARMFPDRLTVSLIEEASQGPDGPVLAAAWIRFHPGTGFASLWGGGTLPEWRRRGLYSSLLVHRAALAEARGYPYLRVDASPDSRPILESLGLHVVATTTPYTYDTPT